MPKYNRKESYEKIHTDLTGGDEHGEIQIVSPREKEPKKFALVSFDSEENDARGFITTHKTLNEAVEHIEADDESEFSPSYVVDLDTGKQWEPEYHVELVDHEDADYFAEEADEEEGGEESAETAPS